MEPDAEGKSVWFELSLLAAGHGGAGSEELHSAWDVVDLGWLDPEEAGPPRFSVALGDVPTRLLIETAAHVDNLVRELTLAGAGAAAGSSTTSPAALAALIDSVAGRFAEAQLAIRTQAQQAVAVGADRVRLELELPLETAAAGEEYLRALDQADEYCRAARLLTLESPPQFRVFREWYVEQLGRQLRAAAAGRPAAPALTFEARLLDELAALLQARRSAERSSRLQRLMAALAGALTAERVAEAVLAEGIRALDANAAALLLPGPGQRMSVAGSLGYGDEMLERLTTVPPDELPSGVAMASGEPIWIESREERDSRFPGLAGAETATVSLCAVPLLVEDRALGVLRFSFTESRLFGEEERGFVHSLAAQAAQALDRARLYTEERAARQAAEAVAVLLARLHPLGTRWSSAQGRSGRQGGPDAGAVGPVEGAGLAYQSVLDSLTDAVVVADPGGTIHYVNPATEKLLGAGPGELSGQPLTELVPPRLRAAHLAGVSRYVRTRRPVLVGTAVRVPALRRDGTEVEVDLMLGTTPVTPAAGVEGDLLLVASLRSAGHRGLAGVSGPAGSARLSVPRTV